MPNLSNAGMQLVQNLSQRHNVSTDAITHMLIAVQNGNGSMAQFNHPEFGGCGQWMRGGMTMVSDLFNNQLKYQVDTVCSDISNELANHQQGSFTGSFQSQSQNGSDSQMQAGGQMGAANSLFAPDPEANWWPQNLGAPNALGSQNQVRYAYFANSCRLAVKTGTDVWVYDTADHQIGGFSQQQGLGGSITFTSQYGTVNLSTLTVISRNGTTEPPAPAKQPQPSNCSVTSAPACDAPAESHSNATVMANPPTAAAEPSSAEPSSAEPSTNDDIIETLERLGGLRDKGYITEDDFDSKKKELLDRL